MERRLTALEADHDDIRRQFSKRFIIFRGKALRSSPVGTHFQQLEQLVWKYWGLTLHNEEVAQVHPLQAKKGGAEPAFVAEFLDRKPGSTFFLILTTRPNWQNGVLPPLFAELQLKSKTDKKLDFIARTMAKAGEISRGHRFHWQSGKLEVRLLNGTFRIFSDPPSLLQMASQVTRDKIKEADSKRRRRC